MKSEPSAEPKQAAAACARQHQWVSHQLNKLDTELLSSVQPAVQAMFQRHVPSTEPRAAAFAKHDSAKDVHGALAGAARMH